MHAGDPEFGFNQHTDYVTCLAAARTRPLVASAGLRGEVLLWDVQKAMRSGDQVQLAAVWLACFAAWLLFGL